MGRARARAGDAVDWLNYHHLFYFWVVAREGSIARACDRLHLAQPTISSQLRKLEKSLGEKLFKRVGRNLILTETGQLVLRYADDIFALGRELTDVLQGKADRKPPAAAGGHWRRAAEVDRLPAAGARLAAFPACTVDLRGGQTARLAHRTGVAPPGHRAVRLAAPTVNVRAYSHLLGECGVSIFGAAVLAKKFRRGFPASMADAPFLLPLSNTALRRALSQWFDSQNIRPHVAGEFEDGALLQVFAQAGVGVFAAPSAIEKEICRQYHVHPIGELPTIRERYYAISVERKLKHPAVVAIFQTARKELFP